MNLSPHFTLEELTHSDTAVSMGISNAPDEQSKCNLARVAQVMEQVRHILNNKSITISSGYRCPAVNSAVGGADASAHKFGLACDFTCPDFGTPEEVCHALENDIEKLGIDQLIFEYNDWVHMGLSSGEPRYMALTIDNNGTETGFA